MKRPQERFDEAYDVCHPRCRTSANLSPFAPCRCRCGGLAHGADTMRGMNDLGRAKAVREMRADLRRGAAMVHARAILGAMRDFERELKRRRRA